MIICWRLFFSDFKQFKVIIVNIDTHIYISIFLLLSFYPRCSLSLIFGGIHYMNITIYSYTTRMKLWKPSIFYVCTHNHFHNFSSIASQVWLLFWHHYETVIYVIKPMVWVKAHSFITNSSIKLRIMHILLAKWQWQ